MVLMSEELKETGDYVVFIQSKWLVVMLLTVIAALDEKWFVVKVMNSVSCYYV